MFGTGGETHAGSLYAISFDDLLQGKIKNSRLIYSDCCKGVMVPPVLIDINNDDILDIIMSLFNSTVIAFDGLTFQVLWKTEFPGSETYRYFHIKLYLLVQIELKLSANRLLFGII
jgi:hypothetical protein